MHKSVDLLRQNPVFMGAPDTAFEAVVQGSTTLRLGFREPIFEAGVRSEHVYVLIRGGVRVFHAHESGRQLTVKLLRAPSTFGEMEVLSGCDYLECAETTEESVLVRIEAQRFREFMEACPQAAFVMLTDVCRRFCAATESEKAPFGDVPSRLAALLLSYAEVFGRRVEDGLQIRHRLTQEDMADGLGVVVRSVARAVKMFTSEGWLAYRKGWWLLVRPDALEELCRGRQFSLVYRN